MEHVIHAVAGAERAAHVAVQRVRRARRIRQLGARPPRWAWSTASTTTGPGAWNGVDAALIRTLIDREVVPIVTTIGWNTVGTAYNLGSDDLAVAVATGMHAAKLFVAAAAPGIPAPARSDRPAGGQTAARLRRVLEP